MLKAIYYCTTSYSTISKSNLNHPDPQKNYTQKVFRASSGFIFVHFLIRRIAEDVEINLNGAENLVNCFSPVIMSDLTSTWKDFCSSAGIQKISAKAICRNLVRSRINKSCLRNRFDCQAGIQRTNVKEMNNLS